ncbi:hypothetical protein MBLNU457_4389t1 [Dothideomycetes sp. NU457]
MLSKHPLAAPPKSVRCNGRSRASRAKREDEGDNFLINQQVPLTSERTVDSGDSPSYQYCHSEDDKGSSSNISELSSVYSDPENDIDDLDFMQLEAAHNTHPPTSVLCSFSPEKSLATREGISAGEQAASASTDDDTTMYDDQDLDEMEMSVMDELCKLNSSAPVLPRLHSTQSTVQESSQQPRSNVDDQCYDDSLLEEELLNEIENANVRDCCTPTPPTSVGKSTPQKTSTFENMPPAMREAQLPASDTEPNTFEDDILDELDLSTTNELPADSPLLPQPRPPIQRTPFPKPVSSHSPVPGLTSETLLRTCFRIGEALNTGCNAVRNNRHELLELYCRTSVS